MRFRDIDKRRNRANFSANLYAKPEDEMPFWWPTCWPGPRSWLLERTMPEAEKVKHLVLMIERHIRNTGRFPNAAVRFYRKDRAWNRAVRIVNENRKGCRL